MTYLTYRERQILSPSDAKALNEARKKRDREFDNQATREGLAIPRGFRLKRPKPRAYA